MSEDHLAKKNQPASALPDAEYDLIHATVSETVQGRRFLDEFARRSRPTETELTLAAIERMQAVVRSDEAGGVNLILEMAEMAQAIARVRAEIMSIEPPPGAGPAEAMEELDSIVHVTEAATSRILAAAEQMQEIAWTLREGGANGALCEHLNAQATEIYTACSFQDLTGQRTRKVIEVLRYLEERINATVAGREKAALAESVALAQADVDVVMRPEAAATAGSNETRQEIRKENRQDATLEDISRLMLAMEPSMTLYQAPERPEEPAEQPDSNIDHAPMLEEVRPELSVAEAVMLEADAAREAAEWAVEPRAAVTPRPSAEATAEWIVEHPDAPRPDSEPAWMILHRMEMELDRELEVEAKADASRPGSHFVPAPPIPPAPAVPATSEVFPGRSSSPLLAEPVIPPRPAPADTGLFVAESMKQLERTLRPASLMPPPELTFRTRPPPSEPLAELATAMETTEMALRQPGDDDGLPHEPAQIAEPAAFDKQAQDAPLAGDEAVLPAEAPEEIQPPRFASDLMQRTAAIVTEPYAPNPVSPIEAMPPAAEPDTDDFLFAKETTQTHADAEADVFAPAADVLADAGTDELPDAAMQDVLVQASPAAAPEWEDGTFPHPALATPQVVETPEVQAELQQPQEPQPQQPATPGNDPLSPIRAMTDAQKIALFS